MIEQRDLDAAVGAGIVDAATAARLVDFTRDYRRGVAGPDEESFRLLTGFNDIFVTIAVGLLLFALGALGGRVAPALGAALVAAASWGLAEYFTRQRRMALPSIALLLAFVGSMAAIGLTFFVHGGIDSPGETGAGRRTLGTAPVLARIGRPGSGNSRLSRTGGASTCRSPLPPVRPSVAGLVARTRQARSAIISGERFCLSSSSSPASPSSRWR